MDDQLYDACLNRLHFAETSRAMHYSLRDGGHGDWLNPKELQELQELLTSNASGRTESTDLLDQQSDFDLIVIVGTGVLIPVCLSRSIFAQIVESFHIPRVFLQSMTANNGHFASFTTFEQPQPNKIVKPQAMYVMISTPVAPKPGFSCCLRIRLCDNGVSTVLFDEDDVRVRELSSKLDLRRDDLSASPISFLVYLLENYGYGCENWRQSLDKDVQSAEQRTGLTLWGSNKISPSKYEQLSKEMHICKTSLIILLNMMAFEEELGQFLSRIVQQLDDLRKDRGLSRTSQWKRTKVLQDLEYHLTSCRLRQRQTELLRDRIKTQIDVMFSFIAQRDAQASMSMAAVAQQDSGAMRTIAVVTLFFLPATLVSAIFSSGVIDNVSNLWWVFLLSVALSTASAFALWFVYMRYRSLKEDLTFLVSEKKK